MGFFGGDFSENLFCFLTTNVAAWFCSNRTGLACEVVLDSGPSNIQGREHVKVWKSLHQSCRPDLGFKKAPDDRAGTTKDQLLRKLKFPELITLLGRKVKFHTRPVRVRNQTKINGDTTLRLLWLSTMGAGTGSAQGSSCEGRNGSPLWEPQWAPVLGTRIGNPAGTKN